MFVGLLFSCEKSNENPIVTDNTELTTKSAQAVVEANNKFAFEFFKELSSSEEDDNYMVSPVSLSLALGMTYNGTDGVTKKTFEQTLHYSESASETNQFYQALIKKLSSNVDGSVLEIANSIWIKDGFPIKPNFTETNKFYFSAEVETKDFSDPKTVDDINSWVSEKTHKKIPTIIDEISPSAVMFLINALYFNANWKFEFDKEQSEKGRFFTTASKTSMIDMMAMEEKLPFLSNDLFSSVELPYENDKFSMVLLLPNENKEVKDVINALDYTNWSAWMDGYDSTQVVLTMPKFKFAYKKVLNDELQALGLENMFSKSANFSKMTDVSVFVSMVLQKTFIDVHEEGTEAAAVTIVTIENTSVGSNPSKRYFNVNRPFLFAIKENVTGSICFMGKVAAPTYEE